MKLESEQTQKSGVERGPALKLSGLVLVLLTSCFVLFSGLGRYPLFNPDEALYAEPAREMLVTGEYVTTLLDYVVRYTKPPLCIWAMALSYKVFGINEFGARFFGAVCAVLLIAAVYLIIARYISVRAAVVGALSLVVAPLFVLTAREAITDMPLALFMAGSQMAFFHAFKSRRFAFAILGYVLLGLAIMTKGPVGLVLPLAILFVYHFLRGELRSAWGFYRPLIGALVVAIIAVPWFAVEITVTKGEYFQEFIVRENFQRFTAVVDNHKQPFWYHAAAMFGGYLPFSLYLPQFFFLRRAIIGRVFKSKGSLIERLHELRQNVRETLLDASAAEDLYFYCFLWASAVLVFFSLSVSKLLPYTLPAFPALAIVVAGELEAAFLSASFARVAYPILVTLLLYSGVGMAAPALMHKVKEQMPQLPALVISYAAIQAGVAFIAIAAARLKHLVVGATLFAFLAASIFGVYENMVLPVVSKKLEGQLPNFAHEAGQSQLPIIVFDMRKPGVPFYALRKVENINGGDELKQRLSQIPAAYILTRTNKLEFLATVQNTKVVKQEGDFALVQFGK